MTIKRFVFLFLSIPVFAFAQAVEPQGPEEQSEFSPQEETNIGPVKFYVIPELAFGVLLEDRSISVDTTEVVAQLRIPGLVFPGINSIQTGLLIEFVNPDGIGNPIMFKFMSSTRMPVAGGFFTGVDVKFAEGQNASMFAIAPEESGTGIAFAGTMIAGFKFMEIAEKVNVSIELALGTPNEPVKALIVIGF